MRADDAEKTGGGVERPSPGGRSRRARAYSSGLSRPSHGAPQRPISASAQAERRVRGVIGSVHWRSGTASCSAVRASSAARVLVNGPR